MKIGKWIAGGIAVAALGGAVAFAQYRDIEQPDYEVVVADDAFELRQYAPMITAEVVHTGTRDAVRAKSFRRLAAYIFGQDRPDGGEDIAMTSPVITDRVDQDEPIAMTAPVISEQDSEGRWRMRFVMPARYTLDTLPTPPSDITLSQVPARRIAAVRFSGNARASDLRVMETRLIDWIDSQGLTAKGEVQYAFYDAPMVPAPLRRNEVMVEVAARN
ncbi:SOUL family heme-binding protein [Qipengyuania nanhaisediminis]|uniref:SOUL family heme-binding protein n=1 Tax=Qipengyuania nanhaisediminis TaxID=604088 RepID=UPI0038B28C2B